MRPDRPGAATILLTLALASRSAAAEPVRFERDLAPLLARHCVRCHRPGTAKGDLSLATAADLNAAAVVEPGKPGESPLVEAITPSAPGKRPAMPREGEPLSPAQVDLVRRWIAEGAVWPKGLVVKESPKAGADWWSLRPIAAVVPPGPEGLPPDWSGNPIDRFIYAGLREHGLTPSPPADARPLIRRLTYDLTGLPPTPEEVAAFVADTSPTAYERLVERLLASPRYGERWGRHWLDVVRFGESRGYERNEIIPNAWPFRDYVIRSFNADKSFDRLVREHLAGDVIGKDNPEVEVGTTFLVCGPYDDVGNQDAAQAAVIRANTLDDVIRATSESFLGLTAGCARCHDHKFDPILARDYYALYATFAGVRHGGRTVATAAARAENAVKLGPLHAKETAASGAHAKLEAAILARAEARKAEIEAPWKRSAPRYEATEETFPAVEATAVRLVVTATDGDPAGTSGYQVDEFEAWTDEDQPRNVALASAGGIASGASRTVEDAGDAYGAALVNDDRYQAAWIAQGPELTVRFARRERVNRVVFSANRNGGFHRPYAAEYRVEATTDGVHWNAFASSADRAPVGPAHHRKRLLDHETTPDEANRLRSLAAELASARAAIAALPPLPNWWAGTFEAATGPFHVFLGGDPQRKGPDVSSASLGVLKGAVPDFNLPASAPESDRRLALANWIVDPRQPLTPRVLVNRVWHYHFGTGLVDTPSDFGVMGGRPTHPELLDWLARRLLDDAWRLKPLHRLIVTSQTYRQSSAHREGPAQIDGGSRWLWRFPPGRLDAEEVRDTMLAIAGVLDPSMGGPGFRLYRYLQDNVATYVPLDDPGAETYRRAVYHHNARASYLDVLTDFDCPDNAFGAPRRASTTTPLQALTMMNHGFAVAMARAFADRLRREAGAEPSAQVARAFALAFGRAPTGDETAAASALIARRGLPAFCRAVLNANETISVD
jgi:hypothetical protein